MEIKILLNTTTNRIIFVDTKTNIAFNSFGKENKMYDYILEHHKNEIEDYKPIKL